MGQEGERSQTQGPLENVVINTELVSELKQSMKVKEKVASDENTVISYANL